MTQKNFKYGKRISVWIPPKQLEIAVQIENVSGFFQMCLDQAPDIMAWAILHDIDSKKYNTGRKLKEVVDEFNEKHPLDPLTQRRQGKWPKHSQKTPNALL